MTKTISYPNKMFYQNFCVDDVFLDTKSLNYFPVFLKVFLKNYQKSLSFLLHKPEGFEQCMIN